MPFVPLAVTASLVAADWGLWDWATAGNHGTIALIAGLLMAPLAVALVWFLALTVLGIARIGARGAASELRARISGPSAVEPARPRPFDIELEARRAADVDAARRARKIAA
jgi:hypothetical protein